MLYLDLLCASVSKMGPKVTAASLYTISAHKRLHTNALLLGKNSAIFASWVLWNNQVALTTNLMLNIYGKNCAHWKTNTYFKFDSEKY